MEIELSLLERLSIEEKKYWLKQLAFPLPVLNIPIDFSTDNRRDLNKESITIILDKCLKDDLEKIN